MPAPISVPPRSESMLKFLKAVDGIQPGGGTALWDAIYDAADLLLNFRDEQGERAAGTKLRILALTDGADTSECGGRGAAQTAAGTAKAAPTADMMVGTAHHPRVSLPSPSSPPSVVQAARRWAS
jgi:Mg-chelatase subunit ChlD